MTHLMMEDKFLKKYILVLRVKHWLKNVLCLIPLIFNLELFDKKILLKGIYGALLFSFVSSIVYIINDIKDIERDRHNEMKKNRPIANGDIPKNEAICIAVFMGFVVIGCNIYFWFPWISWRWLLLYFILNIAYSFGLKNIPLVDVFILASGFLIRILYGGDLTGAGYSFYLCMTVMMISLYLGLGKRRNELQNSTEAKNEIRKVLKFYNKSFLDKNMYMCMGLAIMFYSLWCGASETIQKIGSNSLMWTVPIVIILAMKYSFNIENGKWADPIEVILNDKSIILVGLFYCACVIYILYA